MSQNHKTINVKIEQVLAFKTLATHEIIDSINQFTQKDDNNRNDKISTTQLRKIYNLLKTSTAEDSPLLRAKFAYIKARTDKGHKRTEWLLDFLDKCLKKITKSEQDEYQNLVQFLEAVVSFQRLNGDGNS